MITDDDIRRAVSHRAFEAGIQYQLEGRVQDLRTGADGTTMTASVEGSRRTAYRQTVRLVRGPHGRLTPSGSCTCPVGFNCKHVAAVLLEYQEQAGPRADTAILPPSHPNAALGRQSPAKALIPTLPTADAALPYDVDTWLRSLDAAQEEQSEDYPPTVRKRLLYVLDRGPHSGGLIVSTQSIELKRDSTAGRTSTRHQPDQLLRLGQKPEAARRILLSAARPGSGHDRGFSRSL